MSPAFLILWGPGLFRLTCYYYRKAYYRSFWLAPAACTVRDAHGSYSGETRFPLILQNLHRYAWYFAVIFIALLTWDAILAFRFPDGIHMPIVLEGQNAIARLRDLMGATDPAKAAAGTIRKDFASSIEANAVHGSDSPQSAAFEIPYFFGAMEIFSR